MFMSPVCLESVSAQPIVIQCADSKWDLYKSGYGTNSSDYFCVKEGNRGFNKVPWGFLGAQKQSN
jgi:hypothetical protein